MRTGCEPIYLHQGRSNALISSSLRLAPLRGEQHLHWRPASIGGSAQRSSRLRMSSPCKALAPVRSPKVGNHLHTGMTRLEDADAFGRFPSSLLAQQLEHSPNPVRLGSIGWQRPDRRCCSRCGSSSSRATTRRPCCSAAGPPRRSAREPLLDPKYPALEPSKPAANRRGQQGEAHTFRRLLGPSPVVPRSLPRPLGPCRTPISPHSGRAPKALLRRGRR